MTSLLDARGCLTPAGMAALQRAPVAQAPAELAQHLAACERCQARVLAAAAGRPSGPPTRTEGRPEAGRLWRPVVVIVVALLLALSALAMVGLLQR